MAIRANVLLNDGQTTPVQHTFTPSQVVDDANLTLAKWSDKSQAVLVGQPNISISMRRPTKQSRVTRVVAKVVVPTLETISNSTATGIAPAPQKAYETMATLEFVMAERSTALDRKNAMAYISNLMLTSVLNSAVIDYEMPW